MKPRWSRATLITSIAGAFAVLAALNAYLHPFGFPDEEEYWKLAKNLVEFGTLSLNGSDPSAYRPPLVAWILAPIAATGVQMATARLFFIVFYFVTGVLTGHFLCKVFPSSWWIPAIGTAFVLSHPLYFFSAGNLYPQQVLTPLFLASLILVCWKPAATRSAILRPVSIGLLTGASLLASAPALFSFMPVFALLAWEDWIAMRKRRFYQSCRVLLASIAVVICVAPYLVRNSINVHPGLYLSLNSGINLLLGNSPGTTPNSGVAVNLSDYSPVLANEAEFDANRRLTQAAIENLRRDPTYYARLYVHKLIAGFDNKVETVTHGYNKTATLALYTYMALVWIGATTVFVGLLVRQKPIRDVSSLDLPLSRTFALLTLACYVLSIAGYAIFFTRLRFRIPVDVALAMIGFGGWTLLLPQRLRQRI